ncbi:AAA family ATPase (plasmid) [Herbiconiux sp. KACC 21604]|uniref:AAA family ATPase n=1 Tax=unclassified Herbiconiux TaxID=2618217 RepID=UPI001491BD81|nr:MULTISPECIES: AAA family ATPase [unclassified Herbiconiux]QJU56338.1 AAA family ATPase [Herbiconiux sp. SALV-R1]WPO88845.1 AAA family ATPase [Herbiconiux sp. KACC 21604]
MTFALAVVGSAGSGKSTIARKIARRAGAAYFDKDTLAGPLVEAFMASHGYSEDERETNRFYLDTVMPAEYAALFAVAADNLRLGRSVVMDAPFAAYLHQPGFFEEAAARAEWPAVRQTVLHVYSSEATTKRRLTERALPRDHAKLSNWDAFWPTWGDLTITWTGVRLLTLNNDLAVDIEDVLPRL